jgi:hypothetical protein
MLRRGYRISSIPDTPEPGPVASRSRQLVAEAHAEMSESIAEGGTAGSNNPIANAEEMDPDDLRHRELLEIILPIESVLTDSAQTLQVLTSNRPVDPNERIRWVAILKLTLESAQSRSFRMNEAVAKAQAAEQAILATLDQDPLKLAVLHRCASQLEEAIQRRIRRLKALR